MFVYKTKNNIRIITQHLDEQSSDFAARLETICEELSKQFKDNLDNLFEIPQVVFMTSSSDGRQTATIQFKTSIEP